MAAESDYYAREGHLNGEGLRVFESEVDAVNERRIKARIERYTGTTLHRYPRLHAVDFYAERDHYLVAHVEIKARSHAVDAYPTVYLNVRKYLTLWMAEVASGVPSIFVVGFSCGSIRWVRVAAIPMDDRVRIAGTRRIVKSSSDREPIIEVPIGLMQEVPD